MTANVAASIRARLLNKARNIGSEFELFLVRYACERFLYRLGESVERERCILKGATLLALWMEEPYRATRDIDLLAFGESDTETVRELVATICSVPCPDDGLIFELETLQVFPIRDNQLYGGQRANLRALLGSARISLQVDFGFGDVVTPGPVEARLPTLIDGVPAPVLYAYPQVTTIAEKFETMVKLGVVNSRMKDFYDIWALSETFAFDGAELQQAVTRCFERRGTQFSAETPDVFAMEFYTNAARRDLWQAYGRQGELLKAPPNDFEEVGRRLQYFLEPVYVSILAGDTLKLHWPAAGPWRPYTRKEQEEGD
ncbi:MAG: nucleotidyl transferase AbiEii/AbiGii toxin family protein [Caldilineaceae bacterium]|nr:nucleotidyl transferase AbiEii/AbiGii toxin family protein [Caldilineaceae bacterium]